MYFVLCLCKDLLVVGVVDFICIWSSVVCAVGNSAFDSMLCVCDFVHSFQNNSILFVESVPEIDCFLFRCDRWNEAVVANVQKMNVIAYWLEIPNRIAVMCWCSRKAI